MKNIITLVLVFLSIPIYAKFDRNAYMEYKKTKQFQIALSKATEPFYRDMKATYDKEDSAIYWNVTLKKLESNTGNWADLPAIAKGNHSDFIYMTLTNVLMNHNGKEIYKCRTIYRKAMFGKDNYVDAVCIIPRNIDFSSTTLKYGLITDNDEYPDNLSQESEDNTSKTNKEKYEEEVRRLNEELLAKGLLQEVRKENESREDSNIRQKTTPYHPRKIQNSYRSVILSDCEKKWKTNYRMIKYCVDTQTEAYHYIQYLSDDVILSQCKNKWGTNYRMIKYCYDTQIKAKNELGL